MQEGTDWKELAGQLGRPSGERGIETGRQMEKTNSNMIRRTIDALAVSENDQVLEIGFGNGAHVPYLFTKIHGIQYTGIDISETMLQEAIAANAEAVSQQKAFFILSDGNTIPFADNTYNKIFTVNTIYFWQSQLEYATEIFRVLKPGGKFAIAFGSKDFMQTLPFVQYGFNLFDTKSVEDLLKKVGFTIEHSEEQLETVQSNAGEAVTRSFVIVSAIKQFSHVDARQLY